jgi:hypothetical protein
MSRTKPDSARSICKATGLSLSQWQQAKEAGVDVRDIEALRKYRQTLNRYATGKTAKATPSEPSDKQPMSMEEIEGALRRRDLEPNEARTLKMRIEALQRLAQFKQTNGELIARTEVNEQHVRIAMAIQAFLRRWEREIPALCLGLSLTQSMPLVKARTRELQNLLADMTSEFWTQHPSTFPPAAEGDKAG